MTNTTKPAKPHVDDQRCGNCAYARPSPSFARATALECRWDGPPWDTRGVLSSDWCRRWGMAPAPKKEAARG